MRVRWGVKVRRMRIRILRMMGMRMMGYRRWRWVDMVGVRVVWKRGGRGVGAGVIEVHHLLK